MAKKNCWEVMKCGREPGGKKVKEYGICPAATASILNGVHGGENGGRACWMVAGTFCNGQVQGIHAHKLSTCESCDFYKAVKNEEESGFSLPVALLDKLKKK